MNKRKINKAAREIEKEIERLLEEELIRREINRLIIDIGSDFDNLPIKNTNMIYENIISCWESCGDSDSDILLAAHHLWLNKVLD